MKHATAAEERRTVPGFARYIVSNRGNIRRVHGKISLALTPTKYRSGHRFIGLHGDDGQHVRLGVHVLVIAAFVGPRPDGMLVCHNNGRAGDDRLENLRYDTSAGNRADTYRHGTAIYGSKSKVAKLTEAQVRRIRKQREAGQTCASLARKYGVSESTISKLTRFDTWQRA